MKSFNKKGFTLIELLIVIAIIGILAVAFLPSLLNAPAKGRDAQRLATVQKIQNFLVTQSLAGTKLPDSKCVVESDKTTPAVTIGDHINAKLADFGGVFPKDPKSDNIATGNTVGTCEGQYGYVKFAAGTDYTAAVYVAVENDENGNIMCSDLTSAATPALKDKGTLTRTDTSRVCFAALLQ